MFKSRDRGGAVRKLWPADTARFRDHMLRLDPNSRRLRFGMGASDQFVRAYADNALGLDAVTYGFFDEGELRAAAELRPFGALLPSEAEAAFSVERSYQDSGIGTDLMGRVILAARNRSIKTLYMNCLAENRRMQRIAAKYDATLKIELGEVIGEVTPAYPTAFSLWKEAIADSHGYVMAVLDLAPYSRDAA